MCGIAGLWYVGNGAGSADAELAIRCMTGALAHRGPDDEGLFHEPATGLWLGHRRLAVVDLTAEGRQPMTSSTDRYVITFNGEVYNHRHLRIELERDGTRFRGHSDTEVLLAGIERWGLERTVQRSIGMFAFALWDRRNRTLCLARDRLGIKPLYYGWSAAGFVFGSELKALRATPGFANPISRDALTLLLRCNYIPAPHCIYEGIHKLLPGTMLEVDGDLAGAADGRVEAESRIVEFWSAHQVAQAGVRAPYRGNAEEAVAELEGLLHDAVGLRMQADVPLGAFLSGGVDSSTVVALMQAQSSHPIRTFSIGFRESAFDEAKYARAVARHLGTDHTELYLTPGEALDAIPTLATVYDEPYSDSSQIPTLMVARLARRAVTVALSGDGGDELFGGYNRYVWSRRLWGVVDRLPKPLRHGLAASLHAAPDTWATALSRVLPWLPVSWRVSNPREKVDRLGRLLTLETPDSLYRELVSHWHEPNSVALGGSQPPQAPPGSDSCDTRGSFAERMMYADLVGYLPDDILVKVDRASMAVGLEARVPLLDHRLVEFAWRLPMDLKIRRGQGKWLLRQVLYRHVPRTLIERPKQGFGIPIGDWLRGPLREWADALLDPKRLREEGFFQPEPIRRMWSDHLAGRVNEHYRLWDVLMFQGWLEAESASPRLEGSRNEV
jgi:asparagine synthase (glutamine-hydrolysing)